MSLGSRIAIRGKGAVVISVKSTPREPLLFLYPPWVRTSSSGLLKPSTQIARPSPSALAPLRISIQRRGISSEDTAVGASSSPSAREWPSESILNLDDEHSRETIGWPAVPLTNLSEPSDSRSVSLDDSRQLRASRIVRKVLATSQYAEETNDYDRQVRLAYQAFKVEQRRSWLPDWRVIISDLAKHTPTGEKWLDKALKVELPPESVQEVLFGIDDNIWNIAMRYDCSVELDKIDEDANEFRSFLVSGTPPAIRRFTSDILQMAPNATLKACPIDRSRSPESKEEFPTILGDKVGQPERTASIRNVIIRDRWPTPLVAADKIPVPNEWTPDSFNDYVRTITSSELPSHIHRLVYPKGQEHSRKIGEILKNLFTDPLCKQYITRMAFNTALAYYVKMRRFSDARVLFVHMEIMKLSMDVETFNNLLWGAAKAEDLHNFHFILHLMLRRGFLPNARTWIAFMKAVPALRVKLHILAVMKQNGLLFHLSSIKGVVKHFTIHEVHESLDRNESQEEFLQHMDSRYGRSWLSSMSGNQVLHGLAGRGLISRCWEFLQLMNDRHIEADRTTINTILNSCKLTGNVQGAVDFLSSLPSNTRYDYDEVSYHILFELARRSKSYNLAKVVWKYACLAGATSHRMRSFVFGSLKASATEIAPISRGEIWMMAAGRFIVGEASENVNAHVMVKFMRDTNIVKKSARSANNPGAGITEQASDNLRNGASEPANLDAKGQAKKALRRYIKTIQKIMFHDYTVFEAFRPARSFEDIMKYALELDRQWRGIYSEYDLMDKDWMLENGVKVLIDYQVPANREAEQSIPWN